MRPGCDARSPIMTHRMSVVIFKLYSAAFLLTPPTGGLLVRCASDMQIQSVIEYRQGNTGTSQVNCKPSALCCLYRVLVTIFCRSKQISRRQLKTMRRLESFHQKISRWNRSEKSSRLKPSFRSRRHLSDRSRMLESLAMWTIMRLRLVIARHW